MKILHLISSNGLFGAEKVMLNLASGMNNCGIESQIATICNSHNPHLEIADEAKKRKLSIKIIDSMGRFDIRTVAKLVETIKQDGIEILHTHNYKANFLGLLAAKKTKTPIVATLHGYIGNDLKLRLYERFDRFILRFFDKVVLVDDSLKKQFKNNIINATVINNGIDVATTKSRWPKADSQQLTIGTVGRLSSEKGHKYLLEAFSKVMKEHPNLKLLIVGDGPLREDLVNLSISLGIKGNVDFVGFQKEVSKYYASMDIYVSSSLTERFPVSILEAMSFGKAIVATDVGGTSNLIKDKFSGLSINPASSDEIYSALSTLIKDSTLRKTLGKNASQLVKERYSLDKMINAYKKVYQEMLPTHTQYATHDTQQYEDILS